MAWQGQLTSAPFNMNRSNVKVGSWDHLRAPEGLIDLSQTAIYPGWDPSWGCGSEHLHVGARAASQHGPGFQRRAL